MALVRVLSPDSGEHEAGLARLHGLLLRAARAEAARRSGRTGIRGRELDDLAHQAAADAAVAILRRLPDFRGDSRFSTWAYKFVIFEVSSKLARHAWRRERIQLDETAWHRLPARLGGNPDDAYAAAALVDAVQDAVRAVLTPHQRHVFVAIIVDGMPLDELVEQLRSSRGAIYKTLFDARRKLRAHLVNNGMLDEGAAGSGRVARTA